MLFGRTPRLPIDLMFNLTPEQQPGSYQDFVQKWQADMRQAYDVAISNAQKAAGRNKSHFDKKASGSVLQPGSRVLIRNFAERGGPGKLRAHWEPTTYLIVERMGEDSPVYKVKPENTEGKVRVLHRNLMLPCDALEPLEPQAQPEKKAKPQKPQKRKANPPIRDRESSQSSDEDGLDGDIAVDFLENTPSAPALPEDNVPPEDTTQVQVEMDQREELTDVDTTETPGDADSEGSNSEDEENYAAGGRPQRHRQPPQTLTYGSLGVPEYQRIHPGVNAVYCQPMAATGPYPFGRWCLQVQPALPATYALYIPSQ